MLCRHTLLLAVLAVALGLCVQSSNAFIKVVGTRFVDEDCKDFNFVGATTWRMLEAQAGLTKVMFDGKNPAEWYMDTAKASGLKVLRIFASGTTPELPLQLNPGTYNTVALKALDQVIDAASTRGLRLTLILARNWGPPDSKANYMSWNGLQTPDDFFTSPQAKQGYKDHLKFMVNRNNSVNGRVYKDDPTIMSWNLINEPRYFANQTQCSTNPAQCTQDIQGWISEMSDYLAGIDPNHLITVGEEGFYGPDNNAKNPAPEAGWAEATGQDFVGNHNLPNIHYAAIHAWADNWQVDTKFLTKWVQDHMADAKAMGKPLVLEEFGKNVTDFAPETIAKVRDPVFQAMFGQLSDSLAAGGVLRGALYWMADPSLTGDPNQPGADAYAQDQVPTNTSTFTDTITPAAGNADKASGGAVQGCPASGAAPAPAQGPAPAPAQAPAPTQAPAPAPAQAPAGRRLLGFA